MRVSRFLLPIFCVIWLVTPAFAQVPRPERPYQGLFGSGKANLEQSLTFIGSGGAGFDDNVYADEHARAALPSDPRNPSASEFASFSSGLSYSLSREAISLYASGSGSGQYYFQLSNGLVSSYGGSVGVAWNISSRTHLTASQNYSFQPLSTFEFFPDVIQIDPGETPSPTSLELGGHFGTARETDISGSSAVDFTRNLSKRSSVSVSYAHTRNDYSGSNFDVSDDSISGRFTRTLSKGLGLHVGYGYQTADYGGGLTATDRYTNRSIDAGVDYNRAISFSRRTKLSFATGTSAYNNSVETRYVLTGNVHLNREIGRSWNASVAYNRGVDYSNQFRQPMLSDSLSTGFGGMMSHRLQYHAAAGASRGQIVLGSGNDYTSYTISSGFGFDVSRQMNLSIDYGWYKYGINTIPLIPIGVPQQLNRNTVQANLNFRLPIMERVRRPHASR